MIKIDNIQKSFKGNTVLKGIQLEVHEGDLIHIKGINGSGKSTLLKIIAGLLMQDEGSIRLSIQTVSTRLQFENSHKEIQYWYAAKGWHYSSNYGKPEPSSV